MKYSNLDPREGEKVQGISVGSDDEGLRVKAENRHKYGSQTKPALSKRASSAFRAAPEPVKTAEKEKTKDRPVKAVLPAKQPKEEKPKDRPVKAALPAKPPKKEKPKTRRTNVSSSYFKDEELFYDTAELEAIDEFQMEDYDLNDGLSGTGRIPADALYARTDAAPYQHRSVHRKRRKSR